MKYHLQALVLNSDTTVEISEKEFYSIKQAWETITHISSLTENYRVVVESYRNVEKAKHDVELDHILYFDLGHDAFSDVRVKLNAPIVGYLASSRYFLDSTDRILQKILEQTHINSFNKFRSEIYDSHSQYRFVEELRNYVQHRGLPIDGTSFNNYVEDKENIKTSDKVTALSLYAERKKSTKRQEI